MRPKSGWKKAQTLLNLKGLIFRGSMFNFGKKKLLADISANIVQFSEDAIIAIDRYHNIVMFNEGAQRIFGYEPNEVMGEHLNLLLPERFHLQHDLMVEEF